MCHQTVCLIARHFENLGLPTLILGSALDILEAGQPPRAKFLNYPLGFESGKFEDKINQLEVVREALSNSAKHANTQHVALELECAEGKTTLRVVDRGRGFAPSTPKGHGMDIMKERAAMADASLTINSTPGEGTEVIIIYPSNRATEETNESDQDPCC